LFKGKWGLSDPNDLGPTRSKLNHQHVNSFFFNNFFCSKRHCFDSLFFKKSYTNWPCQPITRCNPLDLWLGPFPRLTFKSDFKTMTITCFEIIKW
jgi:hypothetical protein